MRGILVVVCFILSIFLNYYFTWGGGGFWLWYVYLVGGGLGGVFWRWYDSGGTVVMLRWCEFTCICSSILYLIVGRWR